MEKDNPEELLLLTCSPHITGYNLEQLAKLLEMMVVLIDGKNCFIRSTRIDTAGSKIYGQAHEIPIYGEYK